MIKFAYRTLFHRLFQVYGRATVESQKKSNERLRKFLSTNDRKAIEVLNELKEYVHEVI
jgi:hypothetical protein